MWQGIVSLTMKSISETQMQIYQMYPVRAEQNGIQEAEVASMSILNRLFENRFINETKSRWGFSRGMSILLMLLGRNILA